MYAWGVDVTRKGAVAALGNLTFSRNPGTAGDVAIPASTVVESPNINGTTYRVATIAAAVIPDGQDSAMAAHKKWRRTIFSTPSALTHDAFGLWSGEEFQQRFAKRKAWPDDKALRGGTACPDSWFRQIVTLDDAMSNSCAAP